MRSIHEFKKQIKIRSKRILSIVFAVAIIFSFTHCSNNSGSEIANEAKREKVILELMDNGTYMKVVMNVKQTKQGEAIVSNSSDLMKDDKATCTKMKGSMMDICMADTAMCKLLMGKTMEMCDMDKENIK